LPDPGASIGVKGGKALRPAQWNDRPPPWKRHTLPILDSHTPRASPRPWCLGTTGGHRRRDSAVFSSPRRKASAANPEAGRHV